MINIIAKMFNFLAKGYPVTPYEELATILFKELIRNTVGKKSKDVYEIADNIDEITQKLNDSKVLIESTLAEMEKQKAFLKDIEDKAEENEALAQINQASADAIKESLKRELEENDKKNKKETIA